jgi:hypothetical protein
MCGGLENADAVAVGNVVPFCGRRPTRPRRLTDRKE